MSDDVFKQRVANLRLHGVLAHWSELATADWLPQLVAWEEEERTRRSLEKRIKDARIGHFKPLADYDWTWPKRCDRAAIEEIVGMGGWAASCGVRAFPTPTNSRNLYFTRGGTT